MRERIWKAEEAVKEAQKNLEDLFQEYAIRSTKPEEVYRLRNLMSHAFERGYLPEKDGITYAILFMNRLVTILDPEEKGAA